MSCVDTDIWKLHFWPYICSETSMTRACGVISVLWWTAVVFFFFFLDLSFEQNFRKNTISGQHRRIDNLTLSACYWLVINIFESELI